MRYNFLQFTLDTDTKELYNNNEILELTKGQYELLLYLIENSGVMFTKNQLIDNVWKGRHVTENSIDQIISKLRKVLNSAKEDVYIKTVYGKGLMFVPKVKIGGVKDKASKSSRKKRVMTTLLIIGIISIVLVFNALDHTGKPKNKIPLIFVSENDTTIKDNWLADSSVQFMDQLFSSVNVGYIKDLEKKPRYLNKQQYINNQWKLSPNLKVAQISITQKGGIYTIKLSLIDKSQSQESQTFSNQNLGLAMKSASRWIADSVDNSSSINAINSLIPDDSYTIELYMHGLASLGKGEFEKAEYSFKLSLKEKPDFYLARLQLAQVKVAEGKLEESLAILTTLSEIDGFSQLKIQVETMRGDIYDTQGKYEQAKKLYLQTLGKYNDAETYQTNEIRYNLSHTYAKLTEYQKALEQLNILEKEATKSLNYDFLANVLQKKSSILQTLGKTGEAETTIKKAIKLYNRLEDLLGEAKAYSTFARITTHQSKYKESVMHLEKALLISKTLNFKLGIGATLNELIYLLMVQGNFTKAWQANQEMREIAIEIDYSAMLQISKQYAIDIARAQKNWIKSEMLLKEHLQSAKNSNNKRALLKNHMLSIELYLDEKKLEKALEKISQVQKYIDETDEIRLQPRIDKSLGRYYLLSKQDDLAIQLLLKAKTTAILTKDGEIIIAINNLISEYYIANNQAKNGLKILEESLSYTPLPYPYLLLKSKANNKLGNTLIALDLANECKNNANEFWEIKDEQYLGLLKAKVLPQ